MKTIAKLSVMAVTAFVVACNSRSADPSPSPAPLPLELLVVDRGQDHLVLQVRNNTGRGLSVTAGRPMFYPDSPPADLHFEILREGVPLRKCALPDYPHLPHRTMLYDVMEFPFSRAEIARLYCIGSFEEVSIRASYGDPMGDELSSVVRLDSAVSGR
jgi:hypothetical protein